MPPGPTAPERMTTGLDAVFPIIHTPYYYYCFFF